MPKPSTSDLLRRAPLFAAMPAAAVDGLAARATRKRLRTKQRIAADTVVVVLTGRLDLVGDDGVVVRSLAPPAVAGISVAAGARPSAELRVAEDAELVFVPLDAIVAALRRHPDAALAPVAHLGGVIAELSAEVAALRVHGLVERDAAAGSSSRSRYDDGFGLDSSCLSCWPRLSARSRAASTSAPPPVGTCNPEAFDARIGICPRNRQFSSLSAGLGLGLLPC